MTDIEDFEACYHIDTDEYPDGYWVYVNKVGGGTVGKFYSGEDWDVVVVSEGQGERFSGRITIGGKSGHYRAATEAVAFMEGGE